MSSWDYGRMAARHPEEWFSNSHFNMTNAKTAHSNALDNIDTSLRAHNDCLSENISQYHGLHASLDKKVNASKLLLEMLRKRIGSVQRSIESTRISYSQLEEADRQKTAPLELCLWRIQHRGKRPDREHIRDGLETSLENERETLENTQQQLREGKRKTKAALDQLNASLEELTHDSEEKNQALHIDEMCLRTTHKTWQTKIESGAATNRNAPGSQANRLPPMTSRTFSDDNSGNESQRHSNAERLNRAAMTAEQVAAGQRDENTQCISRCSQMAQQALARTQHSMESRIRETQEMRSRIEGEIRETDAKIRHTMATTTETRQQIQSLEEPLQLTEHRDNWRKQRALREQILDPVSTQLVEHKATLMKSHDALRSRRDNEKFTLSDLKRNKMRLQEDLKDKTAAMHVDLDCFVHDVISQGGRIVKTLSAPKVAKAIKIDPSFAPVAAGGDGPRGATRVPAAYAPVPPQGQNIGSRTCRF